mmetsp:Transcript_48020/g.102886  ORF Transcript_48020/g.102886 Transcript_48020/m.102886 type:complete len:1137 (+) Transcript_48020:107-3517(+)
MTVRRMAEIKLSAIAVILGCLIHQAEAIPPPPQHLRGPEINITETRGSLLQCGAYRHWRDNNSEVYLGKRIRGRDYCEVTMSTNCSITYEPITCPDECPFFVPNHAFSCLFSCSSRENCSKFNPIRAFADKKLDVCMPCRVPGCSSCSNLTHCDVCHDKFFLEADGQTCTFTADKNGRWSMIVNVVGGLVAVLIVLGLIWGPCCPNNKFEKVNMYAIHRARRNRHLTKTLQWEMNNKRSACSFHSLAFNVHIKNICGVGIGLFYNNILFCTGVAVLLWVATRWAYDASDVVAAMGNFDADPGDLYSKGSIPGNGAPSVLVSRLHVCRGKSADHVSRVIYAFADSNFIGLGVLWVVIFIALLAFTSYQKKATERFNTANATMADYAIRITGLPTDETDEADVKAWVEKIIHDTFPQTFDRPPETVDMGRLQGDTYKERARSKIEVDGVSLCYSYLDKWGQVDDALANYTMKLELEAAQQANQALDEKMREATQHMKLLRKLNKVKHSRRNLSVENLGGQEMLEKHESEAKALVSEMFESEDPAKRIKTNGEAFVIFNYSDDVDYIWSQLDAYGRHDMHPLNNHVYQKPGTKQSSETSEKDKQKVKFVYVRSEPVSVNWWFLGQPQSTKKVVQGVIKILCLIFFIVVVPMFIYYRKILKPYAALGTDASGLKTTIMGVILGFLNTIVGIQTWMTSFDAGFHRRENMDVMVLLMNVLTTAINLGITVMLIYRQAYSTTKHTDPIKSLTDISSFEVLGLENEIAEKIYMMMMPGFFFVGNIMTVIMAGAWPWILNNFLAKVVYVWAALPRPLLWALRPIVPWAPNDIDFLPLWRAERMLEPMEVQIGDNANLITIPTLCSTLLFVLSSYTHLLMRDMICWGIFYYGWLRFMHLRFCKKCYYTTNIVDNWVNYLWGVPLSMVAAAWCQWGFRSEATFFVNLGLGRWSRLLVVGSSFLISMIIWVIAYTKIVKPWTPPPGKTEEDQLTVAECQEHIFYSWYNCNPVFVLKCQYHWWDSKKEAFNDKRRKKHPIAQGEEPDKVRFYSVGKEYLFLAPSRQYMAFPDYRHEGLPGDFLEFETYLEFGLNALSCVPLFFQLAAKKLRGQPAKLPEEANPLLSSNANATATASASGAASSSAAATA